MFSISSFLWARKVFFSVDRHVYDLVIGETSAVYIKLHQSDIEDVSAEKARNTNTDLSVKNETGLQSKFVYLRRTAGTDDQVRFYSEHK